MEADSGRSRLQKQRQKKIEELILTEETVDLSGKLRDDDISVVA
eukprot:CAMPEP_0178502842 /NCGR_PEP_ID=MMETSP0696-20121128/17721_1 /TAXON_ID=265572 /ORGANISM="Extubocellulus spinifer, Strain CCMP396" /LENGTH=43 /DNA_ID= /DNA_START= /DNA_END= /DNA_ORIENTATION=